MSNAFIALGGNQDQPADRLLRVMRELDGLPHTQLLRASSLYRTAPVGYEDQPAFVNAVVMVDTGLSPRELLSELLACESRHGRVRSFPNAPRTLDLDLLLYENAILNEPFITLPHPRMHLRAFVLCPLLEIAPLCRVPDIGPMADWLESCTDVEGVRCMDGYEFDWALLAKHRLARVAEAALTDW